MRIHPGVVRAFDVVYDLVFISLHEVIWSCASVFQHLCDVGADLTFSNCWSSKQILAVPDCLTPEP